MRATMFRRSPSPVLNDASVYSQDAVLWHGMAGMSCFALRCLFLLLLAQESYTYVLYFVNCVRPLVCSTVWFVGSPFLVAIGGEPSGRVTERIVRQKEAADITHIGSQCELSLKIPGTLLFILLTYILII